MGWHVYLERFIFCLNKLVMDNHPVVLVAFKDFDNLGAGYLASVLSEESYEPEILDFRSGKDEILKVIKKLKPKIVGFSVIFQYYLHEFKELINYLREAGINSHFSAGGQYASMRYEDLFRFIPSLDSIVRFEGEYTFLELVNNIHTGTDWRKIQSLAYKTNGKTIVNPLRPPEMDLDKFPFPVRAPLDNYALEKKFATILAGRGCVNNCSFCNNTEYIKQSSVPFKRLRKPENVVDEINFLYHEKDCSVFLFEDDDFPVKKVKGSDWIERFCEELKQKSLADKVMWKINCRPDEIDYDRFALMKKHGLYLVFLGIDDGTDEGLNRLHKHMTVEESLIGINILKKLEIGFDYGFMLFQPSSTFISVNRNLGFLRQLCNDGSAPVTFLKLMPFFDTRIEKELRKAGRLKGEPGLLDYDFLISSLDHYYEYVSESFNEWLYDTEGLANIIKWARNYFSVFSHFHQMTPEVKLLKSEVQGNVSRSNIFMLDMMSELAGIFESGRYKDTEFSFLPVYREAIKEQHNLYKEKIVNSIKKLGRFSQSQKLRQFMKI
jgi:anaerobic magnesium-protoporphyrin IX monomethyl ester cyclase